jgi:hypothetical protein
MAGGWGEAQGGMAGGGGWGRRRVAGVGLGEVQGGMVGVWGKAEGGMVFLVSSPRLFFFFLFKILLFKNYRHVCVWYPRSPERHQIPWR